MRATLGFLMFIKLVSKLLVLGPMINLPEILPSSHKASFKLWDNSVISTVLLLAESTICASIADPCPVDSLYLGHCRCQWYTDPHKLHSDGLPVSLSIRLTL